jgi:hypothetical protein
MDKIEKVPTTEAPSAPSIKQVSVKQLDQAALFLADAERVEPFSAAQERKLKRKIDWILLPMVCVLNVSCKVDVD